MRKNGRARLVFAVGLVSLAASLAGAVQLSAHKPFWGDEAQEILQTCEQESAHMATDGAIGQCSPLPIYYILQRTQARIGSIAGEGIAIWTRRISLLAAVGLVAVMVWMLYPQGGLPAFLGAASVIDNPLFFQFAAEARPYMLWLWAYALAMGLFWRDYHDRRPKSLMRRGAISLFLAGLVSPGSGQAFAFWAAEGVPRSKRTALWIGLILVASFAVSFYYAGSTCMRTGASEGTWSTSPHRDLILGFLRVALPSGPFAWTMTGVLCVGLYSLFRDPSASGRAIRNILVTQGLATAALVGLILYFDYFLVQRNFVFMMIWRGILVGLGTSYILSRFRTVALECVATALLLALPVASWFRVHRHRSFVADFPVPLDTRYREDKAPDLYYYTFEKHRPGFSPTFEGALNFAARVEKSIVSDTDVSDTDRSAATPRPRCFIDTYHPTDPCPTDPPPIRATPRTTSNATETASEPIRLAICGRDFQLNRR